jgi:hypothetical protein
VLGADRGNDGLSDRSGKPYSDFFGSAGTMTLPVGEHVTPGELAGYHIDFAQRPETETAPARPLIALEPPRGGRGRD